MRTRPPNKDEEEAGDMIVVQKISGDFVSILGGQTFTFDSVADADSAQAR